MDLEQLQQYLGIDEIAMAPERNAQPARPEALKVVDALPSPTLTERLQEVELAQRLGYLLCKCSWPPQIMVLSTSDFIYRCPRCSRMRDL